MDAVFTWLTDAMSGAPWLAVLAAAGWGVASLVLSPCHLASIPLIVGFIADRREAAATRALSVSTLFALGILLSIAGVGLATAALGRMLGDVGAWANFAVAAVLAVVGLHLIGLIHLPWQGRPSLPQYRGKAAAFLLGLIFGVALGPCTFAYLAPVLGVVFTIAHEHPVYAAALLVAYALGHCVLIVAAGVSTARVQSILRWNETTHAARWLRAACGLFVIGGAIWLVVSAPGVG